MRNIFGFILIAVVAISCQPKANSTDANAQGDIVVLSAEDNKAIIEREITTWELAKTKNFDKLSQIYADDYLAYFGQNELNKTEAIQSLQNATIKSYRMSNIHVKPVSKDVSVIYYDLAQDITGSDGEAWIPHVQSSTVYAKRNGQWRSIFYHEAPDPQ